MSEPRTPLLRVEHEVTADAVVVRVIGELDVSTAPIVEAKIATLRPFTAPLSLDVRDLTFVDSSGLRAMTAARRSALEDTARPVTLVGCGPALRSLLELSGLATAFEGVAGDG
jgi:anti-sigma B factor antagonist